MKKIMFILSLLSICETMYAENIVLLDGNKKKVTISSNQIVKTYPWSNTLNVLAISVSNKGYLKITNVNSANSYNFYVSIGNNSGTLLQDTIGNYYVDLRQFKPGTTITFSNLYDTVNLHPDLPLGDQGLDPETYYTQQFRITK